jgi:serine/threonine-protein kinase RsbW
VTRRLIAQALRVVGVEPDTVSDVEIAVSEACANVLRHAQVGDSYEVHAGFDTQRAFLEIIDQGSGFADIARDRPDDDAESGRGVTLMRALMDKVRFEKRSGDGASVVLEKSLRFLPNSPLQTMRQVTRPASGAPRQTPSSSPSSSPSTAPTTLPIEDTQAEPKA